MRRLLERSRTIRLPIGSALADSRAQRNARFGFRAWIAAGSVALIPASLIAAAQLRGNNARGIEVSAAAPAADGSDGIDARVHEAYPVLEPAPASSANPALYSEKQLPSGVYLMELSGLRPEIVDRQTGDVIQAATMGEPIRYRFEMRPDSSWEYAPLAADGTADLSRFHADYRDGVYQQWSGAVPLPPTKRIPLGPTHEFSRRAIEILLHVEGNERFASPDPAAASVAGETVDCFEATCVHVRSEHGVDRAAWKDGGDALPWRDTNNNERDDLVFDPATGFVHYHLVSLNGEPIAEFQLLSFEPAS